MNNGCYVPIDLFKGGSRSVSVSDISSSLWCELQIEYRYLHPHLSRTSEWVRRKNMGTPVERKTKQMKDGSAIHYEKGVACVVIGKGVACVRIGIKRCCMCEDWNG